jgi:CheY-like chemotaxis protein
VVLARVAAIEQAAEPGAGPELRAEGARAAHQLAGTVGTFGFTRATAMARELEAGLAAAGATGPALRALARQLGSELGGGGPEASEIEAVEGSGPRILAVDDDPLILDSLRSLLTARGLEVVTEDDPRRVLARLPEIAPELVILDIDMPEMDGIELCRRIRAVPEHRGLRVVFLTTHGDAETVQTVHQAGADGHFTKPIVAAELVAWMQRHPTPTAASPPG